MADKSTSDDVHVKKEANGSTQNVETCENLDADDPELDNLLDSTFIVVISLKLTRFEIICLP